MINLAGVRDCDTHIREELEGAGITAIPYRRLREYEHSEVPADVIGRLADWEFERGWYYWIARGPALDFDRADKLHKTHGKVVRVAGHCGCPAPREWYLHDWDNGVPLYHVDTQEGLNMLAAVLRESRQ